MVFSVSDVEVVEQVLKYVCCKFYIFLIKSLKGGLEMSALEFMVGKIVRGYLLASMSIYLRKFYFGS